MKNKSTRKKLITFVTVLAVIIIAGLMMQPKSIDNYVQYDCNVKNFRLSTNIHISKDDAEIAKVSGNIFRFIEDPLTMKNPEGNRIAYAGDDYHLIAQDSHAIVVGDTVTAEMVGLAKLFGDAYNIYNVEGKKIASAKFNFFDTAGELYDANGKLIATYGSFILFNDFTIRISTDCELDPTTALMIFCSYYSDQSFDN